MRGAMIIVGILSHIRYLSQRCVESQSAIIASMSHCIYPPLPLTGEEITALHLDVIEILSDSVRAPLWCDLLLLD